MQLTQVPLRPVAAKGRYIYCYLRCEDSRKFRAYTPYYIGQSSTSKRPYYNHRNVPIPEDRAFIRVLKSGLSEEEANLWEQFFIFWYGRKSEGGCLVNQKLGGEGGGTGYRFSEEGRAKLRIARAKQVRKPHSALAKERMAKAAKARPKRDIPTDERLQRQQRAVSLAKNPQSVEARARAKTITSAEKLGVDPDRYLQADLKFRKLLHRRHQQGIRGEDLWLPKEIQPKTARFCRQHGIDLNKYAFASRKEQTRVRDCVRRKGFVPAEFLPSPTN